MCVPNSPLFQRCQVYDKPLFSKKMYFSSLSRFLTPLLENTHIFAQIFSSESKIVISIRKLCLQTAKRVYKNQRTVYEYVNNCSIKYMNRSCFSKTKSMIWIGLNKTKLCSRPASRMHIFNVWTVDMQSSNIQEWNQITPKFCNVIYSRWRNNN